MEWKVEIKSAKACCEVSFFPVISLLEFVTLSVNWFLEIRKLVRNLLVAELL